MPSWHAVLGCKFPPLGSGGHAAGWTSVAGLSLRVPIRRDCLRSAQAVLMCRNPPPDFWGDYCRDTRHFVVRSNPCSPKAIKGFRPALNAIAPALDEGWGDGGQGGIRTRGDIAASHAFQACAFDHSATCPKVSHGMRAETSQQYL